MSFEQFADIEDLLERTLQKFPSNLYIELRYHRRMSQTLLFKNHRLEESFSDDYSGIGIRVLSQGSWGFVPTAQMNNSSVYESTKKAIKIANALSEVQPQTLTLAPITPIVASYISPEKINTFDVPIEDKIKLLKDCEDCVYSNDPVIKSAIVIYREDKNLKILYTSEGTKVSVQDSRPDFSVTAFAKGKDEVISHSESIGICGGYEIFNIVDPLTLAETARLITKSFLSASRAPSGEQTVVLDPTMVGLIAHEAIGHLVEADFIMAGSAMQDRLGEAVASPLVTIIDSGDEVACGWLPVDDEGVKTRPVKIINHGILQNYLHNRTTAAEMQAVPAGNARAFEFDDSPLIRMRNTYVMPGTWKREEIIEETRDGLLLSGDGEGSADSNAEFMFTALKPYRIINGEITELLRPCSLAGNALVVLKAVDAIAGDNWMLKMGNGYCGKIQPIKVDGGGSTLRSKAIISA